MRRKISKLMLNGLLAASAVALFQLARGRPFGAVGETIGYRVLEVTAAIGLVLVSAFVVWRERWRRENSSLAPSLARGGIGGLAGGAAGGLLVGIAYYAENHAASPDVVGWTLVAAILVFGAFAGALMGFLSHAVMLLMHASSSSILRNAQEAGAVLGAAAGGLGAGAVAGWYFMPKMADPVDSWLVAAAGFVGAAIIALATMLYEYDGRLRLVRTVCVLFLVVTAVCSGAMALFCHFEINNIVAQMGKISGANPRDGAGLGARWGVLAGVLVGLQIGLTLLGARLLRIAAADGAR